MLQHLVGLSTERSDIHASRVATHPPLLCGSGWCGRCDWQAKSSLAVFFKLDTSLFFFFSLPSSCGQFREMAVVFHEPEYGSHERCLGLINELLKCLKQFLCTNCPNAQMLFQMPFSSLL